MHHCDLLAQCPFFNDKLKNMPNASDMMKKMYCKWQYTKCARYKVAKALGKEALPPNMFPADSRWAAEMLSHQDLI